MAIVLETISDSKQAQADLAKLKNSVENLQTGVEKTTEKFASLAKNIALLGSAFAAASGYFRISDSLTEFNTKIKLATENQKEFTDALVNVRKIAISTRSDINSVADLYKKVSIAGRELGASQSTVLRFTDVVTKAIAVGGGGAAQANAAILQLGQGLSSGKLAGDELRSILENAPTLAFALAKGLNTSVGQLKALGEAGQLTSRVIIKALLSQRKAIEEQFGKVQVTYSSAFLNLKNSLLILFDEVKNTFSKSSSGLADFINKIALKIFDFAENFKFNLNLIKIYIRGFVIDAAISLNTLKNSLDLDVSKFFPSLKEVIPKVSSFVESVESMFAWLYDRVVGNSWVPDLVEKVTFWFRKLLKEPLSISRMFTSKIQSNFARFGTLAGVLTIFTSYKTELLSILAVLGSIGIAWKILGDKKPEVVDKISTTLKENAEKFSNAVKDLYSSRNSNRLQNVLSKDPQASENTVKPISERLSEIFSNIKNKIIKPVDPTADISTGDPSKLPKLPAKEITLKRIFNIFPEKAKLPLVAAFTGVFTLALMSAFQSPEAKRAAFAVGTTIGGVFAFKAIDTKTISNSLADAAFGFLKIIDFGLSKIFGQNIIEKGFSALPLLIATIAKLALLFAGGRELIANAIRAGVAAPTNIAQTLIQRGQEQFLRSRANVLSSDISSRNLEGQIQQQQRDLRNLTRALGNQIGGPNAQVAAIQAVASGGFPPGSVGPGATAAANATLKQAIAQRDQLEANRRALAAVTRVRDEFNRQADAIREQRVAAGDALRQGVVNTGGALGGALGGVAGFQLGVEIAKGMTDAPGWKRVGVVISTAILSQAIGTAIGAAITATLVSGIPFLLARLSASLPGLIIRSLLTSFLGGAAIIAAALYTAFKVWEVLPERWKESLLKLFSKDPSIGPAAQQSVAAAQTAVNDAIQNRDKLEPLADALAKAGFFEKLIARALAQFTKNTSGGQIDLGKVISAAEDLNLKKLNENLAASAEETRRLVTELQNMQGNKGPNKTPILNMTDVDPVTLLPRKAQGKATGGWITGPGTGTSDSIPAMLSNGEFVVNAKDAKKNWDILTAINSGKRFQGFKEGTDKNVNKNVLELFDQENATRPFINSLNNSIKSVDSSYLQNLKYYKENKLQYQLYPDPSVGFFDYKNPKVVAPYPVAEWLDPSQKFPKAAAILSYATTLHEQGHAWSLGTQIENLLNTKRSNEVSTLIQTWEQANTLKDKVSEKSIPALSEVVIPEEKIASDFAKRVSILKGVDQTKFDNFLLATFGTYTDYLKYTLKDVLQGNLQKQILSKRSSKLGNFTLSRDYNFILKEIQKDYKGNLKILEEYLQKQPTQKVDELVKIADAGQYKLKLIPAGESLYNQKDGVRSSLFAKYILDSLIEELKRGGNAPPPLEKATGGWIRGPGTGTSDEIPAMLSNGEFVINAKDAAKNWDILTAINNGQNVRRFNKAGPVTNDAGAREQLLTDRNLTQQKSKETAEFLSNVLDSIKQAFTGIKEKIKELVPGIETMFDGMFGLKKGKEAVPFLERIKTQPEAQTFKEVAKVLSDVGFKGLNPEKLKQISKEQPAQFERITIAVDEFLKAQKQANNPNTPGYIKNIVQEQVNATAANLATALKSSGFITEIPDKWASIITEKLTDLTVGDQLKLITEAFPNLGITEDIFKKFDDSLRSNILAVAQRLTLEKRQIENLPSGTLEKGGAPVDQNLKARFAALDERRAAFERQLATDVNNYLTSFGVVKLTLDEIGATVDETAYYMATEFGQEQIRNLATAASNSLKILKGRTATQEQKREAAIAFKQYVESIANVINPKQLFTSFSDSIGNMRSILSNFGVSTDEYFITRLTALERETLNGYLDALSNPSLAKLSESDQIVFKNYITELIKNLFKNSVPAKLDKKKEQIEDAGKAMASSVEETIATSLADVLKGKKSFKEGLRSVLDTFTSSVIDTFVKGLLSPFTGEEGIITKTMKDLGSSIFKNSSTTFSGFSKDSSGTLPTIAPTVAPPITPTIIPTTPIAPESIVSTSEGSAGILDALKSGFSGLLGLFGNIGSWFAGLLGFGSSTAATNTAIITELSTANFTLSSILFTLQSQTATDSFSDASALFFAATGGRVIGSGTGTSDSIPAMLSNGEFVVNAKATKENLKLITAINNGNFKKFAAGGLVSTAIIATPAMAEMPTMSNSNKSSQVINVNITGDISRQTRSQIYEMLPSIAEGVNMHNREKGYKR